MTSPLDSAGAGITGSQDATVRLWDVANGVELNRVSYYGTTVTSVVFGPSPPTSELVTLVGLYGGGLYAVQWGKPLVKYVITSYAADPSMSTAPILRSPPHGRWVATLFAFTNLVDVWHLHLGDRNAEAGHSQVRSRLATALAHR